MLIVNVKKRWKRKYLHKEEKNKVAVSERKKFKVSLINVKHMRIKEKEMPSLQQTMRRGAL